MPPGVPFSFSALNILGKPSVSFGKVSKPAAFTWLSRTTIIAPAQPSGTPIHFLPSGRRSASAAGYHPPDFLPR